MNCVVCELYPLSAKNKIQKQSHPTSNKHKQPLNFCFLKIFPTKRYEKTNSNNKKIKRYQSSLEKWPIPRLGKKSTRYTENILIQGRKKSKKKKQKQKNIAQRLMGALSKRRMNYFEEFPIGQSVNHFSIKLNDSNGIYNTLIFLKP